MEPHLNGEYWSWTEYNWKVLKHKLTKYKDYYMYHTTAYYNIIYNISKYSKEKKQNFF